MSPTRNHSVSDKTLKPRALKKGQLLRTRERVLAATSCLLTEAGYGALTVEQIARRSGVARSTIYRHWDSVAHIAMHSFKREFGSKLEVPDTGSVHTDLVQYYQALVDGFEQTHWGKVIPAMVQARLQDDAFAELIFEWADNWRTVLAQILAAGTARGEIPPVNNVHDVLDPIIGAIYYRLLFTNRPLAGPGTIDTWVGNALRSIAAQTR